MESSDQPGSIWPREVEGGGGVTLESTVWKSLHSWSLNLRSSRVVSSDTGSLRGRDGSGRRAGKGFEKDGSGRRANEG